MNNLYKDMLPLIKELRNVKIDDKENLILRIEDSEKQKIINFASEKKFKLISLFCVENFESYKGFTLFYVLENYEYEKLLVIIVKLSGKNTTSVCEKFSSASWYERETTDGFGITFDGTFDTRRLILHDMYQENFHPMLKSFKNAPIKTRTNVKPEEEYKFMDIKGEGVFHVPVGPVHAGVIEPGHFRFSVIGETIFNMEIRMFYKHRGIEKLAEEKNPDDCVKIAETISGDETIANSLAYCNLIEKICGVQVPKRAESIRIILAEMERIYSHLGDIAAMPLGIAYPIMSTEIYAYREQVLRMNDELTGSRFLKRIMAIGGLKENIDNKTLKDLSKNLEDLSEHLKKSVDFLLSNAIVIDRFETTGIIKKELLTPLNISGPAARASNEPVDTRIDHPYGIYKNFNLTKRLSDDGDVYSRYKVKFAEILDSIAIIQKAISQMPNGSICSDYKVKDGFAMMVVEAPRGQTYQFVNIIDGKIDRYKVRTASFCNWQAIQHAVIGNIVPDFPLINKSLSLSYAGTDL